MHFGALPDTIGNLVNVSHFYLMSCPLSGTLPSAITNMVKLEVTLFFSSYYHMTEYLTNVMCCLFNVIYIYIPRSFGSSILTSAERSQRHLASLPRWKRCTSPTTGSWGRSRTTCKGCRSSMKLTSPTTCSLAACRSGEFSSFIFHSSI